METYRNLVGNIIRETRAAPWSVLRDSLFASFVAFSLAVSLIPSDRLRFDGVWLVVPLSLFGALALVKLWHASPLEWEFYCRPTQRFMREDAEDRAKRKAAWLRARAEAKAEEERQERLWQLTRTDRASANDEGAAK
ncbi:hypothetical protein ACXZ1M_20320 [Duganella sp. PWIR1]